MLICQQIYKILQESSRKYYDSPSSSSSSSENEGDLDLDDSNVNDDEQS